MQREYECHGNSCDQQYVDRFGQTTIFHSVPIKGMKDRNGSINHGPGAKTAKKRPSAKRIERGRTIKDV